MAQTIAFYSYKGGVGRSLALANAAVLLARRGRRVACIDFDLEASGLHTIFGIDVPKSQITVLDILARADIQRSSASITKSLPRSLPGSLSGPLMDLTKHAQISSSTGKLLLLPTVSEISKIHEALEPQRDLPMLLGRIIEQIENAYNPHVILVDSRTGFAELASPPIRKADRLVCVLRPNRQNTDGLKMLLDIIAAMQNPPSTFLLLSQVPEIGINDVRIAALESKLGSGRKFDSVIPYDPDLAFEEYVAAVHAPHSALAKSYEPLAQWLYPQPISRKASSTK